MTESKVVDLVVMPFTSVVKESVYSHVEDVRTPLTGFGAWNKDYTPDSLIAMLDAADIGTALVPAQSAGEWKVDFEVVGNLIAECKGRVLGMAGIDPRKITAGVRELTEGIESFGFIGAHSYPHWFGLSPDDKAYYPFYEKCIELDVPIQIQAGICNNRSKPTVGYPSTFDRVASDFPELRLVAIHTGYPWERELVAVSRKHANLFIGGDDHLATDWAPELLNFLRTDGRKKVLFGTNYPAVDFSAGRDSIVQLGLDDDTAEDFLYGNTRRIYRLDSGLPREGAAA